MDEEDAATDVDDGDFPFVIVSRGGDAAAAPAPAPCVCMRRKWALNRHPITTGPIHVWICGTVCPSPCSSYEGIQAIPLSLPACLPADASLACVFGRAEILHH